MKTKLTTEEDTCGPYTKIYCLTQGTCTLNEDDTECSWISSTSQLVVTVWVDFNEVLWDRNDRNDMVAKANGGNVFLWNCDNTYSDEERRRKRALQDDFSSLLNPVSSWNETETYDEIDVEMTVVEDDRSNILSTITILMTAGAVLSMTVLVAAVLLIRKKRRSVTLLDVSDSESETSEQC